MAVAAADAEPWTAADLQPFSPEHWRVRLYDYDLRETEKRIQWTGQFCYLMPLDSEGRTLDDAGKQFLQAVKKAAALHAAGTKADVYLMSHGWRNSPVTARELYRNFFSALATQRKKANVTTEAVYLGIYWPSNVLDETYQDFCKRPLDVDKDLRVVANKAAKGALAPARGPGDDELLPGMLAALPTTIREEVEKAMLIDSSRARNKAIARAILPIARDLTTAFNDVVVPADTTPKQPSDANADARDVDTIVNVFDNGAVPFGIDDDVAQHRGGAATPLQWLTVWTMKQRAGLVGASGGAAILRQLLATGQDVHAIGHSFGCKLLLEAVNSSLVGDGQGTPAKKLESLTLIQPALSRWAFSSQLPGKWFGKWWPTNTPGAYCGVRQVITRPITVFYSNGDRALMSAYPNAFFVLSRGDAGRGNLEDPDMTPGFEIKSEDAGGSQSAAAALGAHGPDLEHCSQTYRFVMVTGGAVRFVQTAADLAAPEQVAGPDGVPIYGIKGTWTHSGTSLEEGGWCRPSVARVTLLASIGQLDIQQQPLS